MAPDILRHLIAEILIEGRGGTRESRPVVFAERLDQVWRLRFDAAALGRGPVSHGLTGDALPTPL